MKKIQQNIQKMSDNQYYMEQKIITMLSKMEETQLKIIEVLERITSKLPENEKQLLND
jgi:ferritin-like metal-binding protein YciE